MLQKGNKLSAGAITEAIYLTILAMYILKLSFDTTHLGILWPKWYEPLLRLCVCGVIFIRLECGKAYAGKEWLIGILTGIMFSCSWTSTGYIFLIDIALLSIGAMGFSYVKILKTGFYVGLYVLTLAMLGSLLNCIPDYIYLDSGQIRHSFGIVYPTDFAAHVTFLTLAGWVLYGRKALVIPACGILMLIAFVYYFCRAKCSVLVLVLLVVVVCYYALTERFMKRCPVIRKLKNWGDNMLLFIMPVCAMSIILLTCLFQRENAGWEKLNDLMTNRLSLGKAAIETYGISLFGTAFDQIGFGGTNAWSWAMKYNFVDSSYVLLLVRYGLMVLLAVVFLYIWLVRKALRNGQRKLALAAALIAVHSVAEHHLLELAYNQFLLLTFANIAQERSTKECASKEKRKYLIYPVVLPVGIMVMTALPGTLSYIKTILALLCLDADEFRLRLLFWMTVWIFGILLGLGTFYKIIISLVRRIRLPKRYPVILAILTAAFIGALWQGEQILAWGKVEYRDLIEEDAPLIEKILATEGGKIYVEYLPELYKRTYGGISNLLLTAEGMANSKNTTLIVKDEDELHALFEKGYEYAQLNSGNGLYTNDITVKNLLLETGISLNSYYCKERKINLEEMALKNNLMLMDDGSILLNGPEQSLRYGSGTTIYKGMLRVEYKLCLVSNDLGEEIVGTAILTSDWRQRVCGQKDITLEDFDEKGQYTCAVDIKLTFNSPNMEFLLMIPNGVQMKIEEITYQKIG